MDLDCSRIVAETKELLKLQHDMTLEEATPPEFHDALARVIMMHLSADWSACKAARGSKRHAYYFSAEYLIGRRDTFRFGEPVELLIRHQLEQTEKKINGLSSAGYTNSSEYFFFKQVLDQLRIMIQE